MSDAGPPRNARPLGEAARSGARGEHASAAGPGGNHGGTRTNAADLSDEQLLDDVQRETFAFFLQQTNEANGLVADSSRIGSPCSIAATGLALASYPVAVTRGWMPRVMAVRRTLAALEFLASSRQDGAPDASGYKGFYFHFLEMETGRRTWRCELSTIDSTFLIAGALSAAAFFDGPDADDRRIRALADALYRRMDWRWALDGGPTVSHGWTPESGFLPYRWEGYCEALLLYALALGSPTFPAPTSAYDAWCATYAWRNDYGIEWLYAGPLFIHQLSHAWIDFRGQQDAAIRTRGIDYFENSVRATRVQCLYAETNPGKYPYYGRYCWGITAGDGPGPAELVLATTTRRFLGYAARGAPLGPDDGTYSPWVVVASLPFAPDIVLPTMRHLIDAMGLKQGDRYGFEASFNPLFPESSGAAHGWRSEWNYGINQGPIVLMVENHRTGLPWALTKRCPYVAEGLRRAGFDARPDAPAADTVSAPSARPPTA
jgi:hypothetical protein